MENNILNIDNFLSIFKLRRHYKLLDYSDKCQIFLHDTVVILNQFDQASYNHMDTLKIILCLIYGIFFALN